MSQATKELDFESHIESHLVEVGGYGKASAKSYDRELCLIPGEVAAFVKATQPEEFKKLEEQYGSDAPARFCQNLAGEIARYGTLHVLRRGYTDRGAKIRLCYFRPSSGMNPEHLKLYQQNRFTVVRQLKYSLKAEHNALDMGVFVNGIPILTMELKNSLTGQMVEDAAKQYKKDRDPHEPLFQFKRCLVHFAVGNEKVFMTTRLTGDTTQFLPFNLDTENPVNPEGHKTAYLWEQVLAKDSLLDLLQNYLHVQINTERVFVEGRGVVERQTEAMIFPRYHQLDCVRSVLAGVKAEGVGNSYLIQHSAGSGKSNSIAWIAHKLATLYQKEADTERLFDSIIVVTDRRILDRQLQNTIKQFEQEAGVVVPIDENSAQLRLALEQGKSIIVTTLQKFPVIAKEMVSLKGKHFAVIIDEAHSSQSGESSKHLKSVLSANLDEAAREEENVDQFDLEDEIAEEMALRGRQKHISYFAFTATPKNKTLELFGRKEADGRFKAFHTYTMRQAIEEGFILDVLENYTTFKRFFKLAKAVETDKEYEKKKAIYLLTSYVDLQPHAFEVKTKITLDHFMDVTYKAIQGKGRAMVVTKSRLHAVRFQLAFAKELATRGLPFKSLVAFSGTVVDPDTGLSFTEENMNHLGPKIAIADALKTPEYRILIAANKFQTGFDEPLLHTMYVDKLLGGVNAVQTLSRLNRTRRGKTETVVLDFVNEAIDIQKSFQDYYQVTYLEEETDPNKLYQLRTELEQFDLFTRKDVEDLAIIFFNPKQPAERLQPIPDAAVGRFRQRLVDEQEEFRSTLQSYVRLYAFVAQLISFQDSDLEKLYVFSKSLNRKLPKRGGHLPYDVLESVNMDSFRVQETFTGYIALSGADGSVKPIGTEGKRSGPDELDFLSNIIKVLNETYGLNLTDEDKVDIASLKSKVEAHNELQAVKNSDNTEANVRYKFEKVIDELFLDFVNTKLGLYKKLTDPQVNAFLKERWFEEYYKQGRAPSSP